MMKLLEPINIGNTRLKNRIMMAPMGIGGLVETDGCMSKEGIEYFVRRAQGGVGLLRVGFTRTNKDFEMVSGRHLKHLTVDDKVHIRWLSKLAESVHDYGVKISIQLSPGVGRIAGGDLQKVGKPISASNNRCFWPPHETTNDLSKEEIRKMVSYFEISSAIIQQSGFDMIELHGHEGYLLDQFSSSLWNRRQDEYGGSLENRMRFAEELVAAIKRGAGRDFPVMYRYGLCHFLPKGRRASEGLEIAKILEDSGVDMLDIDSGSYETWYYPHPPSTMPRGFNIEFASEVKKRVTIPVSVSGKMGYPDLAEKVLKDGKADMISLGRALLADPDWPEKVLLGSLDSICYCIGCHEGCLKRIFEHKHISCAVNPAAGNEVDMQITPANKPKRIMVIGGGIAGMEAARVSALRGHEVILCEKKEYLGGNFREEYLPEFKHDYQLYLRYLKNQVAGSNVKIRLGCNADLALVDDIKPDVIFWAAGSNPSAPQIKGLGAVNYYYGRDVFLRHLKLGKKIIIIGGGLIGCEVALYLAQKKHQVLILEKQDIIGRDIFRANRMHLINLMEEHHVEMITGIQDIEITAGKIRVLKNNSQEFWYAYDEVVIACGSSANAELYQEIVNSGREVYNIGDSVQPRKVIDAVWEAYRKARLI